MPGKRIFTGAAAVALLAALGAVTLRADAADMAFTSADVGFSEGAATTGRAISGTAPTPPAANGIGTSPESRTSK